MFAIINAKYADCAPIRSAKTKCAKKSVKDTQDLYISVIMFVPNAANVPIPIVRIPLAQKNAKDTKKTS